VTDDVLRVSSPEHFKALAHPMRQRLLLALGESPATVSQLAAELGSHKGNIAHHLKVLVSAGLVTAAGTRQVRGGTERYYRRTARRLDYSGPDAGDATAAAFQVLAAEIAGARPDPFVVLRTLRLTHEQATRITATLRDLSELPEDAGDDRPRYRMLLGLYQPPDATPAGAQEAPRPARRRRTGTPGADRAG
jgi:DNA-binding transcriptional ArsR family regulator